MPGKKIPVITSSLPVSGHMATCTANKNRVVSLPDMPAKRAMAEEVAARKEKDKFEKAEKVATDLQALKAIAAVEDSQSHVMSERVTNANHPKPISLVRVPHKMANYCAVDDLDRQSFFCDAKVILTLSSTGKEVASIDDQDEAKDLLVSGDESGMEEPSVDGPKDSKTSLGEATPKASVDGEKSEEASSDRVKKKGRSLKGKETRLRVMAHQDVDTGIKCKADIHTSPKKV